jgi:hypothetical protein
MNRVFLVALLLASVPAAADTLGANPNDPGSVTFITKGVKEIDLGGVFVLSYAKAGEGEGQTRISTLGGVGFQYFLKDNLSVGAQFLASYDQASANTSSTAFGGAAFASLHIRLGLGAFLRPTLGLGALFGTQQTESTPGQVASANQIGALVRIGMPFAYFPSARIVLQAGPELDISVGNVTPEGGDAVSFTNVTGGFGVSAGYAF